MRKILLWSLFFVLVFFSSCAFIKPAVRTIVDAARITCQLWATEQPNDMLALGPEDFCAVEENLRPFIDQLLAAKRTAGGEVLLQIKRSSPDAGTSP